MFETTSKYDPNRSFGARLLVAHSYYMRYDEKQSRKGKPYAPLATLGAAALARADGHEVEFFDAMLAPGVEAFERKLDLVRPSIVGILEDNFNFLTKMCTLRMRRAALDMIAAAHRRGCLVVVNGSDAIDQPELYLRAGADAVLLDEAEAGFLDIVRSWTADPSAGLRGVPGLALLNGHSNGDANGNGARHSRTGLTVLHGNGNGERGIHANGNGHGSSQVHRTAPRPRVENLDALPYPAWDLIDVEEYRATWVRAHGRLSWSMVTSRGCPYGCNWCAKPVFGRRYSQRSPAHVAEELRQLRQHVAPDHIWFADDIFGLTTEWIEDFAREVTARRVRTPFMMQSRANLMTPRTVRSLREAGAEEVWLGVESGSQRILDAMEKGTTIQQIREATRSLKAEGIRACWFIQLGYLGERRDDLGSTRALILEERPDEIGVSVSYPLPGTTFHETVRSQLDGKRNWEQTDSLDMLFHGTYTTDFYRLVRDLLHAEVVAYRTGGRALEDQWAALWAREQEFHNPDAIGA